MHYSTLLGSWALCIPAPQLPVRTVHNFIGEFGYKKVLHVGAKIANFSSQLPVAKALHYYTSVLYGMASVHRNVKNDLCVQFDLGYLSL